MKKFFTLLAALFVATTMMGQMHGPMKFVGASNMSVSSTSNDNPSDTILFEMADMATGHITLPAMKGMQTIPSFTIRDLKFSMGADHVITFAQQPFSSSVTVGGEEKTITGTSFSGTYNMADHALSLTAVFKYGKMPLEMTYTIKSYYVKAVSGGISVSVGGAYTYDNKSVTYQVRKYMDGRRSLRPARGGGGSCQGSVAYRRDELDGLVLCRSQAVAAVERGGEGGRSAKGPNRMDALPYSYVAHR